MFITIRNSFNCKPYLPAPQARGHGIVLRELLGSAKFRISACAACARARSSAKALAEAKARKVFISPVVFPWIAFFFVATPRRVPRSPPGPGFGHGWEALCFIADFSIDCLANLLQSSRVHHGPCQSRLRLGKLFFHRFSMALAQLLQTL